MAAPTFSTGLSTLYSSLLCRNVPKTILDRNQPLTAQAYVVEVNRIAQTMSMPNVIANIWKALLNVLLNRLKMDPSIATVAALQNKAISEIVPKQLRVKGNATYVPMLNQLLCSTWASAAKYAANDANSYISGTPPTLKTQNYINSIIGLECNGVLSQLVGGTKAPSVDVQLTGEISHLKSTVATLNAQVADFKKSDHELRSQIAKLNKTIVDKDGVISKCSGELNKARIMITQLHKQDKETTAELAAVRDEVVRLQNTPDVSIAVLNQQLESALGGNQTCGIRHADDDVDFDIFRSDLGKEEAEVEDLDQDIDDADLSELLGLDSGDMTF